MLSGIASARWGSLRRPGVSLGGDYRRSSIACDPTSQLPHYFPFVDILTRRVAAVHGANFRATGRFWRWALVISQGEIVADADLQFAVTAAGAVHKRKRQGRHLCLWRDAVRHDPPRTRVHFPYIRHPRPLFALQGLRRDLCPERDRYRR